MLAITNTSYYFRMKMFCLLHFRVTVCPHISTFDFAMVHLVRDHRLNKTGGADFFSEVCIVIKFLRHSGYKNTITHGHNTAEKLQ